MSGSGSSKGTTLFRQKDVGFQGIASIASDDEFFDDFDLGEVLGRGTFSIVYNCDSLLTRQRFACKVVDKNAASACFSVILNEVRVQSKLQHPNVLRLHRVYESPIAVYLVCEYADQGTVLQMLMSQYPSGLPERLAAAVFADVLRALAYLHRQGVVHGDVKPENVLLTSSDHGSGPRVRALLADFGFSRRIRPGEQLQQRAGTPQYVAPEVLLGDGHGVESDLWSAGVLLYVLLSGRMPFFGNDDAEMFDRILHARFHFHSPFFDHVSPDAKDMVAQLLQRAPVDRPTAATAAEHPWLMRHCESSPSTPSSTPTSASATTGRSDHAASRALPTSPVAKRTRPPRPPKLDVSKSSSQTGKKDPPALQRTPTRQLPGTPTSSPRQGSTFAEWSSGGGDVTPGPDAPGKTGSLRKVFVQGVRASHDSQSAISCTSTFTLSSSSSDSECDDDHSPLEPRVVRTQSTPEVVSKLLPPVSRRAGERKRSQTLPLSVPNLQQTLSALSLAVPSS